MYYKLHVEHRWILLLCIAAALLLGRESAAWHVGRGTSSDADTLKIGDERFRLKGVAAPEGGALKAFAGRRWIACRETGRLTFGRYEAFCYTLAGQDIGAAAIRAGLACAAANPKWRVPRYAALERPDRPRDCGFGS